MPCNTSALETSPLATRVRLEPLGSCFTCFACFTSFVGSDGSHFSSRRDRLPEITDQRSEPCGGGGGDGSSSSSSSSSGGDVDG